MNLPKRRTLVTDMARLSTKLNRLEGGEPAKVAGSPVKVRNGEKSSGNVEVVSEIQTTNYTAGDLKMFAFRPAAAFSCGLRGRTPRRQDLAAPCEERLNFDQRLRLILLVRLPCQ